MRQNRTMSWCASLSPVRLEEVKALQVFSGLAKRRILYLEVLYMKRERLRRLTMAALCGAVAFVLMYFSFSVPVLSPFAEFDLSALPEMIGGFILGPVGAIEIIVIKIALKLLLKGSSSLLTGEILNFILSLAHVLPALLYYRRHRTKKGAIIGLALGTLICVVISVFGNIYLTFPLFIKLYGMNWENIISACSAVNPWIKDIPTMIAFSIVPFNLLSRSITSLLTFLVYKKLSVPIKKLIQEQGGTEDELQRGQSSDLPTGSGTHV